MDVWAPHFCGGAWWERSRGPTGPRLCLCSSKGAQAKHFGRDRAGVEIPRGDRSGCGLDDVPRSSMSFAGRDRETSQHRYKLLLPSVAHHLTAYAGRDRTPRVAVKLRTYWYARRCAFFRPPCPRCYIAPIASAGCLRPTPPVVGHQPLLPAQDSLAGSVRIAQQAHPASAASARGERSPWTRA